MTRQPLATIHGLRVGVATLGRAVTPGAASASRAARSVSAIAGTAKPAARQTSTRSGGTQIRLIPAASSVAWLSMPCVQYTHGRDRTNNSRESMLDDLYTLVVSLSNHELDQRLVLRQAQD